jgi:hypothetical protein
VVLREGRARLIELLRVNVVYCVCNVFMVQPTKRGGNTSPATLSMFPRTIRSGTSVDDKVLEFPVGGEFLDCIH